MSINMIYIIGGIITFVLLIPFFIPLKEDFSRYKNKQTSSTGNNYTSWKTHNSFLGKYELYFYKELSKYLGKKHVFIFSKIHISDLVQPQNKISYREFTETYNKLNQEQVDYVITDYNGKILCILDLKEGKQEENTWNFHAEFCESLGIPFLQFSRYEQADFIGLEKYLKG